MNKRELARAIHKETKIGVDKSYALLSSISYHIAESLKKRESARITNFGTFDIYFRKKFKSQHPQVGIVKQPIEIPASFVIKFKASNALKKKVNPELSAIWHKMPAESSLSGEAKTFRIKMKEEKEEKKRKEKISERKKPEKTEPKKTKKDQVKANLMGKTVAKEILSLLPEYSARLYNAVPLELEDDLLIVAMKNPKDLQAIEFIKKKTKKKIKPIPATDEEIVHLLNQYSGIEAEIEKALKGAEFIKKTSEEKEAEEEEIITEEAPTAKIVRSILTQAVRKNASDIHIEPTEKEIIIRYRIDGVLKKITTLPKSAHAAIISKIKILSNLKIDETRLPQDGRFKTKIDKKEIDFRVSTFPTVFGEKAVMRILDKSKGILSLEKLGLRGRGFKVVEENIHKSHGMTLVTGPTGSGKTTTLYAIIDRLNNTGQNIVTLEDPVEYQIAGVNQGQVKPSIGFSFSNGLRSILRQDPDVVMVGEIRDIETAELAIHAALTGHIVLSTLHTNNASGSIPRLIDMKIEPFLLASALNTTIAQRLARKICENCKEKIELEKEVLREIEKIIDDMPEEEKSKVKGRRFEFFKGRGCKICSETGFKGRIGVFEVLPMTTKISELTVSKASEREIEKCAKNEGMLTMKQDGIIKALDGITTIEEVFRITKD